MTSPVHITRTIRELESWIAKRESVSIRRRRDGVKPLRSGTLVRAARQLTEYRDHLDRELHPVIRPTDGDEPVVEEIPDGSPELVTVGTGTWWLR